MSEWSSLIEHAVLFLVASLIISIVYNGLRRENVADIIRVGIRRFLYFSTIALVIGVVSILFARWL